MTITAAADGSALGNPGPAGWSWYINDECWAAEGWKHATNNQGELKAVLELFRATAHVDDDLLVLCDSQYVINSVTKWMPGWKKKGWRKGDGKPVLNLELLKELDDAIAGRRYRFEWVRGHVGHVLNEAADVRARAAAEAYQRGRQVPSGPGFTLVPTPAGVANPAAATSSDATSHATAAATSAALGHRAPQLAAPTDNTLFSFDDEPADAAPRSIVVRLNDDEHARLERRAREQGVTPEELLRGLI